jgi:hypothetical protein
VSEDLLIELERNLAQKWAAKTLEEFRKEAELESDGTCYDDVRVRGGRRFLLIICATGATQIRLVESKMALSRALPGVDWAKTTMVELASKTARGAGLGYEDVCDSGRNRTAIVVCATSPESVTMLETLFALRP